jgi:hypothetical protein
MRQYNHSEKPIAVHCELIIGTRGGMGEDRKKQEDETFEDCGASKAENQ